MQNGSTLKPTTYKRRKTHTVWVGQVGVGGHFPIRVQSMCTADTKNTAEVLKEMKQLVDAGCEIVRLTVPTQADCDNLPNIRAAMKDAGIKVPLVADIHFTPSIALKCVEFVDKVRVNPGNFVDKKLFQVKEYTDEQYVKELERIREKFIPLVRRCKELGVAMRVGTNHGSLSDRIMNRYGDTALGMVESALEFLRICEEENFRQVIISMKASNVQVMTAAYRLLAARMDQLGWTYPFHLGVTEAGEGEDGRIKSAIGIGALLEDGLGDTIRVSLTEDPVFEVPVCYQLVEKYNALIAANATADNSFAVGAHGRAPLQSFDYARRANKNILIGSHYTGEKHLVRFWNAVNVSQVDSFISEYQSLLSQNKLVDTPLEGIELIASGDATNDAIKKINDAIKKLPEATRPALALLVTQPAALASLPAPDKLVINLVTGHVHIHDAAKWVAEKVALWAAILKNQKVVEWIVPQTESLKVIVSELAKASGDNVLFSLSPMANTVYGYRKLTQAIDEAGLEAPIHLRFIPRKDKELLLSTAVGLGTLLTDGMGDSLQIDAPATLLEKARLAYNILQGCRLRISKTEYISCPSCGRTLFNLQTTTDKIREQTGHLKGVKIAVMGCIVNGPGEMADADFGYVGTGVGKISLYVGKECVERNLPEEKAVLSLIDLIKKHDRWVEPVSVN